MHISGSGSIPAGEYNDRISISGSGRISGDVRCEGLSCSGAASCEGSVSCRDSLRTSGACRLKGSLEAASVAVSGTLHVGQDVTVGQDARVSGVLHCSGKLKCTTLKCSGSMEVGQEAEAEEVIINGRIRCAGLLNAERIAISLNRRNGGGSSQVGSLGGSEIKVQSDYSDAKRVRLPLLAKLVGTGGTLTVDELVEGDTVALECVTAPCVVGRVVAIGAGCEIGTVRYSEEVEIHPEAKIGKLEKL